MMQDLREKTKIVMIVVALAFVGLMVFEWGMDISGQSAAGQTGELGRVNGEPVSYQAYMAAYQTLADRLREQSGGQLTPEQTREIEDAAFNEVVNELLLAQELERRGITVTNEEIRQAAQWSPHPDLMRNELFQTEGQFDINKYQQFLTSPAANEQLLLQLEQYYRSVLPRAKLMRQVQAGMHVSDAELWQLWLDRNQTATVDYVALDLSQLVPGDVQVSESEIEAYYDANEEEFERPAAARLTVAYLPKGTSAADTLTALRTAQRLRQEIEAGADFAELARAESADPGSAQRGGDLGTFERGQMVPAFDAAVFSLPIGAVSEPVQTPFGYHLIQVQEREGDEATARHILIPIEATEESLDRLYARADSLELLTERGGLQRGAKALNAQIRPSVTVSAAQPFVPGVGSVLEAVQWAEDEAEEAADEATGTVSPLFETSEAFYVVELEEYSPAGVLSLEAAAPQIRRELIVQKKREQARRIGQEIVAEARGGKTLEQAAQARGLEVQQAGPFTRMARNPVFGQANPVVGAAFGTPIGAVSDVVESTAGLFILRPTDRSEPSREAFEAEKEQLRQGYLFQLQQRQAQQWIESLRRAATIVDRRSEVLQRT